MEAGAWRSPVVIEMYGRPGTVIVNGTLDAALMLIGAWPTKRTESHVAAVLCCRDVLLGQADASLARVNFIDAAIEAGYRIEPETFLSVRWDLMSLPDDAARPALGLAELIRKRAIATVEQHADAAMDAAGPPDQPTATKDQLPVPYTRESQRPRLRDLVLRLVQVLGLIGMEICRQLAVALGFGLLRRTDRQAH
ncbi:DUF982 domain-containing protein [Aliirhizobium smilacinae]|uniref:DUF982 domain-containing protein n=1 Tax=Aliirhizobium smilacinae TaxID=1395944 RepID=A0A5C4XPH6_9HYPH|nr:DUF982 domain-containing protein [Rhizobium smilacinae]TNM65139.1 DUF982 domain-containing protein [Rhizobium smilacinae]